MPMLRGRAATPIRPGFTIKSILSSETPLYTGEYVSEAAVTDLHITYRMLVKTENLRRPRDKRLRGMVYSSFSTLFRFAHLLNLVEVVREEPMIEPPPPGGPLLSIRIRFKGNGDNGDKGNGEANNIFHANADSFKMIVSTRRIFKLTDIGIEDERAWSDLNRAWREEWEIPVKLEYGIPVTPRIEIDDIIVKPVTRVIEPIPVYVFNPTPELVHFESMLAHLKLLVDLDERKYKDEVVSQMDLLSEQISTHWIDDIDTRLAVAVRENLIYILELLRIWESRVSLLELALYENDIYEAIDQLAGLVKYTKLVEGGRR